mgnify:CR=1 FL=1
MVSHRIQRDPIEVGSLVLACPEFSAIEVGGVTANIGHAEPAAGLTGLVKLVVGLRCSEAAPNAQLRALNVHVGEAIGAAACACSLPSQAASLYKPKLELDQAAISMNMWAAATASHAIQAEYTSQQPPIPNPYTFFPSASPSQQAAFTDKYFQSQIGQLASGRA